MASRRRKSQKARKSPPAGGKNLTLPLPFEIRDQILSHLLLSTQDSLQLKQGLWPLYRCGSEYIRATTERAGPHVDDPKLSKQFRTLTQVSRQMRTDAIIVLFYRNKWNLEISLFRDQNGWGRQSFVGWDSGSMVRKLWGPEAILSMRYLKVTIQNENKSSRNRMQIYLQTLVKVLSLSRNLRRLEVEWLNYESLDTGTMAGPVWHGVWYGSTRHHQKERIRAVSRKADGTRSSTKHFRNGVSRWEDGQKILEPLERLRGIPEVVVTGCVTDKWAKHLEQCMKSDRQTAPKQGPKKSPKKKVKVTSSVGATSL